MNINASIIDQQLASLLEKRSDWLPTGNANRKRSAAFVLLCMANCLDIPLEDAVELLTECGNDAGVDGLNIDEMEDGEFMVTVFQGKYKINNFDATANFLENGVQKAVDTVQVLFEPAKGSSKSTKRSKRNSRFSAWRPKKPGRSAITPSSSPWPTRFPTTSWKKIPNCLCGITKR